MGYAGPDSIRIFAQIKNILNKFMNKLISKFSGSLKYILIVLILIAYAFFQGVNSRKIIGLIIALFGISLWLIARYQLGEAFAVRPAAKMIVSTGIYKKIRHPIYLCTIITGLGGCIIYNIWWLYVLWGMLIISQSLRARAEEKIMLKTFPSEYSEYKKSTWF